MFIIVGSEKIDRKVTGWTVIRKNGSVFIEKNQEAGTELMQTINEDIKNGTFKPVYLLYGEEAFLKQSYKKKLRAAISGDDTMNYNYFEGKGLDVNELISLADTMPFFSERRLILIEDSGFFKTSSEALAEYLPTMPDTTCIVFVEEAVDKRNKL